MISRLYIRIQPTYPWLKKLHPIAFTAGFSNEVYQARLAAEHVTPTIMYTWYQVPGRLPELKKHD